MTKALKVSFKDVQCALIRVRQVDPACEETAVQGYLLEMQEAEVTLDAVDVSAMPLSISFSALWNDEHGK
jgi:hypothetical protein